MSNKKCLITLGALFLTVFAMADDVPVIDPLRPELDRLIKNKKVEEDKYEIPYMWCEMGKAFPISQADMVAKVRARLQQNAVAPGAALPFPKEAVTGKNKTSLPECTTRYCWVKLNTKSEIIPLIRSKDKLETYKSFIEARVAAYHKNRSLMGYEKRESNLQAVKEMLAWIPALQKRYPNILKFANTGAWSGQKPAPMLRSEIVNLGVERIEPIFRVGEVYELTEAGTTVFLDMHIYSNHYFDASVRLIEVLALPPEEGSTTPRSGVVFTDLNEIDELKKSGLIRTLFTGQMVNAVKRFQNEELNSFEE